MKTSESIDELAKAMSKAQGQIGGAVKDAANPFFKSKYADLGAVIKAIKAACAEHGLSYVQFPAATSNRIGITTRLMHESGQWMEQSFTIPAQNLDPQKAGSVLTYFRRYSLAAVFGVPQVDDDAEMAMLRDEKPEDDRKAKHDAALAKHYQSVDAIQSHIAIGELSTAYEAWNEIPDEDKMALWLAPSKGGCFTTKERAVMKSDEWNEARKAYHGEEAAA